MVSRRQLLAAAATSIAATAGCNAATRSGDDRVAIDAIEIENQDSIAHEVTVVVRGPDDETRFQQTVTVDAGSAHVIEAPVDGEADYTIHASLGDTSVREPAAAYAAADESCVVSVVRVDSDGDLFMTFLSYTSC